MVGTERKRAAQLGVPIGLGLTGAGIDEIYRNAFEMPLCDFQRLQCFACAMQPAEEMQRLVVQALDAQRHPIDPGHGQIGEIGCLHAAGIGFQRDLDSGIETPQPIGFGDQFCHQAGRHQRRCSAAEKDACQRFFRICLNMLMAHVRYERVFPDGGLRSFPDMAVEVAIRAFCDAERPVNVECAGQL
jgi:hypothetical protein